MFQGVRYTALEGEVDEAQILDILEKYFGARTRWSKSDEIFEKCQRGISVSIFPKLWMCPKAVIFVAQSEEEGKVSNWLFREIVPALSLTLICIVVRSRQIGILLKMFHWSFTPIPPVNYGWSYFFAFEAQICIYVVFDLKTQFSYKNYNNKSLFPITPQHYEGMSVNLQTSKLVELRYICHWSWDLY